jgi:DNA-binding transcriptional LysR family regulator
MDVELRHLRFVVAVEEERSFTRAAARLHVDQPSLSRQIGMLERMLGVRLFERTTRTVRPTAAGVELARSARKILASVDSAIELARRSGPSPDEQVLRLGYLVPLRGQMMTRLVRDVERRVPGLRVVLTQFGYDTPDAGLASGDVDVAIVNLPLSNKDVVALPLLTEQRVVVISSDHPFARLPSVTLAQLDDLDDMLWAIPPRGDSVWRAFWSAADHRGGRLPERRCEPRNPDEYAQLVAAGKAFGLNLPAAAEPFLSYGIAAVPVSDLSAVTICLAWRRSDPPRHEQEIRACVGDAAAWSAVSGEGA